MTDKLPKIHDLHPPGDRPGLRGQAAEMLIQATDTVEAGQALFDLIAADLKLNAFFLYVAGAAEQLEFITHGGLFETEAEAAIAAARTMTAGGKGAGAPAPFPLAGHITGAGEEGATFLRSLGLRVWFGQPLM